MYLRILESEKKNQTQKTPKKTKPKKQTEQPKPSGETSISCLSCRLIQDTKYRCFYSTLEKKNEGGFVV